jgi:hypothetical protein
MLQDVTLSPSPRTLEFGIYRDGDNNLDVSQEAVLAQALDVSAKDPRIAFTVQDTTSLGSGQLHTNEYQFKDGAISQAEMGAPHDMSSEQNLARFVERVLDNAEKDGAKQTWINLVDHGGGDGGGLETHDGKVMSMPQIARAIADGVAMHAKEHPEDAGRNVDGVVANQCLMDTLGFAEGYYIRASKLPVATCGGAIEGWAASFRSRLCELRIGAAQRFVTYLFRRGGRTR